jgi:hypothetical protein
LMGPVARWAHERLAHLCRSAVDANHPARQTTHHTK